ncbi:hypothetical protein [Leptospira licerasiae]|uniref:hypothetical protein n=1 Tax=Leptospira licerasiae TaxID=447106 RepID=UPI003018F43D
MADLIENKLRRVIPNWRSYKTSLLLGELNSFGKNDKFNVPQDLLESYIYDWSIQKDLAHAGDLCSAAVVHGLTSNEDVKEAATFILKSERQTSGPLINLAERILQNKFDRSSNAKIDIEDISQVIQPDKLATFLNREIFYKKIRDIKSTLKAYPRNAIQYVELSRYYSILGERDKAIKCMELSLALNRNNRFILRSAVRLYSHFGLEKNAQRLLLNSRISKYDPWLVSAELAVSMLLNESPRFYRVGMELLDSGKFSPFDYSELASSLGTIEMFNGKKKKSKDLFALSLQNPNDNALAQFRWASHKESYLSEVEGKNEVLYNYEPEALWQFYNGEYERALDNTIRWFIDLPYARRPVLFGSIIGSVILKDQGRSIELLKAGLVSHPNDPQMLNGLAYSLALLNKTEEASAEIKKAENLVNIENSTRVCLAATRGLIEFRKGNFLAGRMLYLDAMKQAKELKIENFYALALVNYAREEVRINSEVVPSILDEINKLRGIENHIEIKVLKDDVLAEFNQRK